MTESMHTAGQASVSICADLGHKPVEGQFTVRCERCGEYLPVKEYMSHLTHPEAQGNKDLGEPQTSFAWQGIETAPKDGTNILGSVFGVERSTGEIFWWQGAWRTWDGENHTRTIHFPTHWAPLPPPPSERSEAAPTSPQPIKGESDAEKAERDLRLFGTAVMRDGKHVPLEEIYLTPEEIELASNGMGLR